MKKLTLIAILLLTLIACSKEEKECQCFYLTFERQHSTNVNDINGKFDYKLTSTCEVGTTNYTFDEWQWNGIVYCFDEPLSY